MDLQYNILDDFIGELKVVAIRDGRVYLNMDEYAKTRLRVEKYFRV